MKSVLGQQLFAPLLVAFLSPTVATATILNVINQCSYPVWMWVVPQGVHSPDDDRIPIPAYTTYSHQIESKSVSLKFRDLPFYEVAPAGIYQAEYKVVGDGSVVYYDSSLIDCNQNPDPTLPMYCPFASGGIRMYTSGDKDTCPIADCQLPGPCMNTYLTRGSWYGEPSFACPIQHDISVEFCTVNDGHPSIDMRRYPESGGRPLDSLSSTVSLPQPLPQPLPGPGIDPLNPCMDDPATPRSGTDAELQIKDKTDTTPRADGRCGKDFGGATCDPEGRYGGCCSTYGWCGSTDLHCLAADGCQNGCKHATTTWLTENSCACTPETTPSTTDESTFVATKSAGTGGYECGPGEFGSSAREPTPGPIMLASINYPQASVQPSATRPRPTFDLGPDWYIVPADHIVAIYDPTPRETAIPAPTQLERRRSDVLRRKEKLVKRFQA